MKRKSVPSKYKYRGSSSVIRSVVIPVLIGVVVMVILTIAVLGENLDTRSSAASKFKSSSSLSRFRNLFIRPTTVSSVSCRWVKTLVPSITYETLLSDIAVGPDDRIYVGNQSSCLVYVYKGAGNGAGQLLTTLHSTIGGCEGATNDTWPSELYSMEVDVNNNLYVSDRTKKGLGNVKPVGRVVKYQVNADGSTALLAHWTPGRENIDGSGRGTLADAIAVEGPYVYVIEKEFVAGTGAGTPTPTKAPSNYSRLVKYGLNGAVIETWGGVGTGIQFDFESTSPGIEARGDKVVVKESRGFRILRDEPDGASNPAFTELCRVTTSSTGNFGIGFVNGGNNNPSGVILNKGNKQGFEVYDMNCQLISGAVTTIPLWGELGATSKLWGADANWNSTNGLSNSLFMIDRQTGGIYNDIEQYQCLTAGMPTTTPVPTSTLIPTNKPVPTNTLVPTRAPTPVATLTSAPPVKVCNHTSCMQTGCSGQLCMPEERMTSCDYRPEYACYSSNARCELRSDGCCGWTYLAGYSECVSAAKSP